MPYQIIEREGKWCVVLEGAEDQPIGCHDSEADAEAQRRALYAAKVKTQRGDPLAALAKKLLRRARDPLAPSAPPPVAAFKTVEADRWLALWTNNFRDREGEIFSQRAIDDYIARVDLGIIPMPELWFWHLPGTRIGQAQWLGRIGHYAVAAGTFDDTPLGRAAAKNLARGRWAVSHGFVYNPRYLIDGVYHRFNTFEISVLPAGAGVAANPYALIEEVADANQ